MKFFTPSFRRFAKCSSTSPGTGMYGTALSSHVQFNWTFATVSTPASRAVFHSSFAQARPYSTEGFDRVEGVWACSGTPARRSERTCEKSVAVVASMLRPWVYHSMALPATVL